MIMDIAAAVGANGEETHRSNGSLLKLGQGHFTQLSESHSEVCSSLLHHLNTSHTIQQCMGHSQEMLPFVWSTT